MHHLASRSQRSEGRSRFHFQGFKVFEDEGHTFLWTSGTTPSNGHSHHKRPEPSSEQLTPNQIHRVSRRPKVHYRPQLDPIQSQTNPVHTLPP